MNDDVLYVSPEGHYRTTLDEKKDLVYVVLTDSGEQITLRPDEFAKKYGWKNDPEKVGPLAKGASGKEG